MDNILFNLTNIYIDKFIYFLKENNYKTINYEILLLFLKINKNIKINNETDNKIKTNMKKLKKYNRVLINNENNLDNYSKKNIKFLNNYYLFSKVGINNFNLLKKINNYKIINFLYNSKKKIEGIIFIDKTNLNLILNIKIPKKFYIKMKKNSKIIKEITNNLCIYEYKLYEYYLSKYRNLLYSLIFNILESNININSILFEGVEFGGNILQLFIYDFFDNYRNINIEKKRYNKIKLKLKQYNSPMLSEYNFYKKLISIKRLKIKNIFSKKNKEYKSWDIDILKKEIL